METQIDNQSVKKVESLLEFLGLGKDNAFGLHESSRKIVYHQKNFSAFLEGRDEDVTPICVEIVPSILCNFNCPSCTYRQNGSKECARKNMSGNSDKGLMNSKTFDSVVSGLKNLSVKSVIVTGGGEPSMNPNYLEFMRTLKNAGLEFALYSNAARLSQDINSILELNPKFVRLSLNSGDASTHARMYGVQNMFEEVVENIAMFGRAKKYFPKCQTTLGIGFIMGLRNSSDNQLKEIAKTLEQIAIKSEERIDYAAFRPEVTYFTNNSSANRPEICTKQNDFGMFSNLPYAIDEKIKIPMAKSNMKILIGKDGFEHLSKPYKDGRNIAAPWSISINYDGQPHLASEGNGNPAYSISNHVGESLEDSWKGERKRYVAEKMASDPSTPSHIPLFPHYKLMTTNALLLGIRDKFGRFTPDEVSKFYSRIDLSKLPEHVNFI